MQPTPTITNIKECVVSWWFDATDPTRNGAYAFLSAEYACLTHDEKMQIIDSVFSTI
jgi:hypothetical protein